MVFLSSSVTPDIAASIVVLLQRARQLDVRWTVLGPSNHEAWPSLRKFVPYIELCACQLHLGSGLWGSPGIALLSNPLLSAAVTISLVFRLLSSLPKCLQISFV